ncbi:hypothetical protein AB6A40_004844 [Gnathostoma spinigerum]|uniref:Alpha-1,3-glucosyltransferase n=1 Tax=Gnathostoma spinigerum TaxID=75299 RepID=A0ABD6EPF1_9BILA
MDKVSSNCTDSKDVLSWKAVDDTSIRFSWFSCYLSFLFVIHVAISIGSYSGHGTPPMFGDYEAQRHWMEITLHLPMKDWYFNGTNNDLNYWGLDYPPLTALHSLFLGRISSVFNASWVELHSSRGIETDEHKLFMRSSVLFSLWLLYLPVLILFINRFSSSSSQIYHIIIATSYPGIICMDLGHFQYNHISLGFFIISVYFFLSAYPAIGSLLFVMAVNYKQMELYHSLPIAVFLLSSSIFTPLTSENIKKSTFRLFKLFFMVVGTFAMLWVPFYLRGGIPGIVQILSRIFPFYRGIFEDKVANFWFALNVVVKIKRKFPVDALIKLSTTAVLIAHIPSLYVLWRRPSHTNLKQCLLISSLSFFLFSFQVHEKSILLAALPAILVWDELQVPVSWFLVISANSLYSLCIQDGNSCHLAYLILFYIATVPSFFSLKGLKAFIVHMSCLSSFLLCLASLLLEPPRRYPHIFPLLVALFSFLHFAVFLIYFNLHLHWNFYKKQKES